MTLNVNQKMTVETNLIMNYLQLKIVDTINYQQLKGQLLWLKSMDRKKKLNRLGKNKESLESYQEKKWVTSKSIAKLNQRLNFNQHYQCLSNYLCIIR